MGFNMKEVMRAVLGEDIDKMTDQQLAETIGRLKEEREKAKPQTLQPQDLQGVPIKRWGDDPYMVKLVRFIPRPGAQPCPICSQLVGKYAHFLDAGFFLSKAETDHAAPFCLTAEPATAWPGSLQLPDRLQDAEGNTLNGMDLNKVNDAIYYREHPRRDD